MSPKLMVNKWQQRCYNCNSLVSRQQEKLYLDFMVTIFHPNQPDRIKLLIEIGSIQSQQPTSSSKKTDIVVQLQKYMVLLGEDSECWASDVLGMAILGTEVAFSWPQQNKNGTVHFTNPKTWYSLYSPTFFSEMNRVAQWFKDDNKLEV